jgi:purine-binding chemotaxis protein CheW
LNQVESNRLPSVAMATVGQYLTFLLGGQTYALGILAIKEIIEHERMTRVPMMPGSIRGVINLRGAVVPVIDLGVRFGSGPTAITRRSCIVIVEVEHAGDAQVLGILVDTVNEVMDMSGADIEPAPAFGAHIRTDFIAGMGRIGNQFVVILDPAKVLSVDDMALLASTAGGELLADPSSDTGERVALA